MVTSRDRALLVFLMIQAAVDAGAASAYLAQLAPMWVVALFGLLSAMLSAATGVYVVATREPQVAARGLLQPPAGSDGQTAVWRA